VPIPHRDLFEEAEAHGIAAYLRVVENGPRFLGALFLVNALGEPLEFTYTQLEVQKRFLWRAESLRRHAARRLAASLFAICPRVPDLLLCLAGEVEPELFSEEIEVRLPVARLAPESAVVGQGVGEERELTPGLEPGQLFWLGTPPAPESLPRTLLNRLVRRGLLLEPFDRAEIGLREVYGLAETG
jgi:hypothetical protein